MKPMRFSLAFAILLFATQNGFSAAKWYTNYNEAMTAAKAQDKALLLDFTGSDWCGWCMRLKSEVFDTPEFEKYAEDNIILVEVDFPHSKPQTAAQKQINESLASKYHIEGFPTVIILDKDAKQLGGGGYQKGGPRLFINFVDAAIHRGSRPLPYPYAAPDPEPAPAAAAAPPVNLVPAPKRVYTTLQLKGITGSKSRKLALINGQAFGPGEEAKLTVGGKTVAVKCVTITDFSVDVLVDGEAQHLLLGP